MNFCFYLFYRFLYLFLIFISFIDFYFLQNISMNWILFNYWILSSFSTFFLSIFIVVIFMLILHIWIPTQGSTTHDNVFTGGGRSEVIRMKQPGPGTWTWIGKSDPVMGRSPLLGDHRHIFIIYLNLPTQYNNSHVIPACVALRWHLYTRPPNNGLGVIVMHYLNTLPLALPLIFQLLTMPWELFGGNKLPFRMFFNDHREMHDVVTGTLKFFFTAIFCNGYSNKVSKIAIKF